MAAACRRTEAILAQDSEKEHEGLKDVTPGPSEVIAHRALEVGNAAAANVPATLPVPSPARKRRRWGRIALLVVMLATAAVGSYYWWKNSQDDCPRASCRATAASKPMKSTLLPSSPAEWLNSGSRKATW